MVIGKFKAGALNSLSPSAESADEFELGTVQVATATTGEVPDFVADAALDQVLEATHLSPSEATNDGAYDDAMLGAVNVDSHLAVRRQARNGRFR